jgi:hypothetical protein
MMVEAVGDSAHKGGGETRAGVLTVDDGVGKFNCRQGSEYNGGGGLRDEGEVDNRAEE